MIMPRPNPQIRTAGRKKIQEAVHNPAAAFDHPMQVVETPELPIEHKQKALETWEEDERALQRASEEGMTGGQSPRLHEVKQARQELEEDANQH